MSKKYEGEFIPFKTHMGPATTAVDLTDGSERGEYVDQDYILRQLGRPHRCINLMYCYYPNDEGWPKRAHDAHAHDNLTDIWDYPYDDYFTYKGGIGGNLDDEPFNFMRDVRRHGQDVCLTLTMDPFLDEAHISAVCKDLAKFGRVQVRVNHEATGNWFSFNKRASYEQVAAFFVKVCEVFHKEAPNCKLILCLDGCKNPNEEKMEMEDIFADAARACDIVSVDRYMALHWGYPVDVCDFGGNTHQRSKVEDIYNMCKKSYERYAVVNNGLYKPMVLSELNADADVTGPYDQAAMFRKFADMLEEDKDNWLNGFTMYMFRDRGRLGLEIQDPNNENVGIRQPLMDTYREMIHEDFFSPKMEEGEKVSFPAKLRWGSFEDSDGIAVPLTLEKTPVFFELFFNDGLEDANLMIEIGGEWFYKAPGVKCIDLASAFFNKKIEKETEMALRFFAPPATGENDESQGDDWQLNYYYELPKLPEIRIVYEPIEK
ncbi:MAG: hypothetical protein IKR27_05800 [Lachnospiraceae bacterium]|nr:hypothetical protein [Lachnospiraceae bacterium]